MKVKNPTTGNWDTITLGGGITIDNSLSGDSTTHGASVHAVNQGLAGKISGDGSVEKIVRSETAPTGTEATIWIEPSDFNSAEVSILKDTLEDEDLDKAPTVHAVKQAIDNVENVDYDSLPVRSKIEYTKENSWDQAPSGYTESSIPYTLEDVGGKVDRIESFMNYPQLGKESVIGYWFNGKPIYRKVISLPSITSINVDVSTSTGISNLDKLISLNGMVSFSLGWMPLNFHNKDNTGYSILAYLRTSDNKVVQRSQFTTTGGYAILEYTKTTDSAIELSEVQ